MILTRSIYGVISVAKTELEFEGLKPLFYTLV